ncbi:MAG: phosphoribosylglycinamide formyltransferase [Sphingomonadales bacterium]|jgi:phosphoribosylglycinamide formyltransferase-1
MTEIQPALPNKRKIAILISGRGSNMESLIKACAKPEFPAEITLVLSNVSNAAGLEKAQHAGLPTQTVLHQDFEDREQFEDALDRALRAAKIELICLAGFMRLLTTKFVHRWKDRILNIHPSLLPAFKGLHTHERALEAGVRFTGCTVHFVRPEMDDGPIIIQAAVPILNDDTAETLAARVLAQEHLIYPEALRLVAGGHAKIHDRQVKIGGAKDPAPPIINPPLKG